jgi:hypothetical protein
MRILIFDDPAEQKISQHLAMVRSGRGLFRSAGARRARSARNLFRKITKTRARVWRGRYAPGPYRQVYSRSIQYWRSVDGDGLTVLTNTHRPNLGLPLLARWGSLCGTLAVTPDVRIMLECCGSNEEFVRARTKFSTTAAVLECTPTVGTGATTTY